MNPILSKTLWGLDNKYYFKQLILGLIFLAVFYFISSKLTIGIGVSLIALAVVKTLLYPYSRFIYEKIVDLMVGNKVFSVHAIFLWSAKLITMYLCWFFAVFIAPVGLCYLYYYNTKNNTTKLLPYKESN